MTQTIYFAPGLKPVIKFNPNHDDKGRFSTGTNGGGELNDKQKMAVSAWTSLGNKSSWRKIANDLSEGKTPDALQNDIETVKTLVDAIKQNGVIPAEALGRAELLTTGLRWQGALPKVGDSLKNELSSATINDKTAERFSQYSDFGGAKGKPVIFHYGHATKGLDVNRTGADSFADENEWLVSGTFKVTDMYSENGITHIDLKSIDSVKKFNPNHDEVGRFASGNNSIATESLSRVGGKELNYDWYVQEGSNNKTRDAEVIGQLIHEQGWDKPSLSASVAEFEELAGSGDFVRLYRGAPAEALQGLLDGKPWIGNGKAGAGTYVATSRERAQLFAGGGTVHEFLMPKKMFENAMTARQVREFYSKKTKQLGVPEQEWDDAGKFALSAHSGNGLLYAFDGDKEGTAYSNFASDYVVYNTSALIVKVNK